MTINHKDWDIDEHVTGRFKDGKPIIGALFQNGLNDIEPDGSFVTCDMGVKAVINGVTTLEGNRGRWGELRFTDTGSTNKHLCKIKYKDGKGISFKYLGGESSLPDISNGKPSFVSSNGIIIEHTPTYNGVRIELVINDPLTAPTEHSFSIKKYGQDYTFIEQDGGIVARGEDLMPITIHAPYAMDANGEEGPVSMVLTDVVGAYQTFKKIVDETWLRQAAAPVRLDPVVTIKDGVDGGVVETNLLPSATPNNNMGAWPTFYCHKRISTSHVIALGKVLLTDYSGVTVIDTYWLLDITTKVGVNYATRVYPVKKDWIEGTKNNTLADPGEPTWLSQKHNLDPAWASPGCQGSGTDHEVAYESEFTITGTGSDFQVDLTNATVQGYIDSPSTNNGFVFIAQGLNNGAYWLGDQPAFYMEYTEGIAIFRRRREGY